ncbi:MAG: hypothetical protein K2X53_01430 [Alphaproteobacteria bacterium]|nr:hypothetical protein [Alphaproteobacteria bacterium]
MHTARVHLEEIFLNPEAFFKAPEDVLTQNELPLHNRILILKLWALDQKLMETADSENMVGPEHCLLSRILNCINTLEQQHDVISD